MDSNEAEVIEAYALNIATRASRRYFGVIPIISGTIRERPALPLWKDEDWQQGRWIVTLEHKTRWYSFDSKIEFNFPKIDITIDIVTPDPECSWKKKVHAYYWKTVNVADPESKDEMKQFFTETYRRIRKDMKAGKYRYLVDDKHGK